MKLAFKRYGFGFTEKEVDILLNIGTLEAVCKALHIEFWQIADVVKKNNFDFTVELLYQGYITARKEKLARLNRFQRLFIRSEYKRVKAFIWYDRMDKSRAQKEFLTMMTDLFGEITKMSGVKKKVTKK